MMTPFWRLQAVRSTTLKAARAGLNWTRKELAQQAGLDHQSIAYWETTPSKLSLEPDHVIQRITDALARHGVTIKGNTVRFRPRVYW